MRNRVTTMDVISAAPFGLLIQGALFRIAPAALVVFGAGRGFSILPAGFWCEVRMDAWVGGCRWEPNVWICVTIEMHVTPSRLSFSCSLLFYKIPKHHY